MADKQFSYQPIGKVLDGIEILDLPDGHVAFEVVVAIKTLKPNGATSWWVRYTREIDPMMVVGALHFMAEDEIADMRDRHSSHGQGEDHDDPDDH